MGRDLTGRRGGHSPARVRGRGTGVSGKGPEVTGTVGPRVRSDLGPGMEHEETTGSLRLQRRLVLPSQQGTALRPRETVQERRPVLSSLERDGRERRGGAQNPQTESPGVSRGWVEILHRSSGKSWWSERMGVSGRKGGDTGDGPTPARWTGDSRRQKVLGVDLRGPRGVSETQKDGENGGPTPRLPN